MTNTEALYDHVGDEILRQRGKRLTSQLKDQMMGRPSHVALQIMIDWHGLPDSVAQLERETDQIFDRILPKRLAPMPGLLDLLARLQAAGIPKAVATSSRRKFALRVLSQLGIDQQFQFVLAAEDVRWGKPDPEIYLAAARKLGLPAARVLVLEDSPNGCRAAVAAGACTVAVPGTHSHHHLFPGVWLVADSLADPRILAAMGL